MKRTIIFLATAVLILAAAPVFAATSASANLSVTAAITPACTITTQPVAFGTYDPIGANATTDLPGTGRVDVACTVGSGTRIDLDLGSHFNVTTRRMAGAVGGDFLTYELFKDSGLVNVWGSGATNGNSIGARAATDPVTRQVTVYGNLLAGQDVTATTYSDVVQATIQF